MLAACATVQKRTEAGNTALEMGGLLLLRSHVAPCVSVSFKRVTLAVAWPVSVETFLS